MSSPQLPNYLRANRKRLALSQDDVAFLLGSQSGAKVSRYERFARVPSLETALACQVIYKRPVSELFGGLYQKVQSDVTERAKVLVERTDDNPNRQDSRKRQVIAELAAAQPTA